MDITFTVPDEYSDRVKSYVDEAVKIMITEKENEIALETAVPEIAKKMEAYRSINEPVEVIDEKVIDKPIESVLPE